MRSHPGSSAGSTQSLGLTLLWRGEFELTGALTTRTCLVSMYVECTRCLIVLEIHLVGVSGSGGKMSTAHDRQLIRVEISVSHPWEKYGRQSMPPQLILRNGIPETNISNVHEPLI